MRRSLILVGGGGHCKSVIEVAQSAGFDIKGILDLPEHVGEDCLGIKVIGTDDDIQRYAEDYDFVVTLGFISNPERRVSIHKMISCSNGNLATIIAPTAIVSKYASIGPGSVILHHVTVNASAHVGVGCIINTSANIEHDVIIEDYCHISTGAMVNGACHIGASVFIGSGSVICNGVHIENNTVIGAGAVVCHDINEAGTYVGVPAKKLKYE
ncbi:MAG: acetyltransferase [Muribaculaceae bacterium]|nr:acetyltransferase [Muribaculaceae bacterium]